MSYCYSGSPIKDNAFTNFSTVDTRAYILCGGGGEGGGTGPTGATGASGEPGEIGNTGPTQFTIGATGPTGPAGSVIDGGQRSLLSGSFERDLSGPIESFNLFPNGTNAVSSTNYDIFVVMHVPTNLYIEDFTVTVGSPSAASIINPSFVEVWFSSTSPFGGFALVPTKQLAFGSVFPGSFSTQSVFPVSSELVPADSYICVRVRSVGGEDQIDFYNVSWNLKVRIA